MEEHPEINVIFKSSLDITMSCHIEHMVSELAVQYSSLTHTLLCTCLDSRIGFILFYKFIRFFDSLHEYRIPSVPLTKEVMLTEVVKSDAE